MNMTVSNTSLGIGDGKSNTSAIMKLDKGAGTQTFADIHAALVLSDTTSDSGNRASTTASSATGDTVTAAGTSTQTETLTASQQADQLFIHGMHASRQSADPKAGADGSQAVGQAAGGTATNNAQTTTTFFPTGTFKAMFGELPSNVDRSGLSGIIDGQGHNLTNQEITSYFDQNPSTAQMEQDKIAMGLSNAQMANAIAIAMGQPHTASALDSNGNKATDSSGGSVNAVNNRYAGSWDTSGIQSGAAATSTANAPISYIA